MISISDKAHDMLQRQGGDKGFVRINIKSGGCAGMTYDANIVTEKGEGEEVVYQEKGITVITDSSSLPYLHGLEMDYSDDLISAGFRFNNSSNDSSCGCGSSFSVAAFPQLNKEKISYGV